MKVILDFINVDTKAKLFSLFNEKFNFNEDCNNLDDDNQCQGKCNKKGTLSVKTSLDGKSKQQGGRGNLPGDILLK